MNDDDFAVTIEFTGGPKVTLGCADEFFVSSGTEDSGMLNAERVALIVAIQKICNL